MTTMSYVFLMLNFLYLSRVLEVVEVFRSWSNRCLITGVTGIGTTGEWFTIWLGSCSFRLPLWILSLVLLLILSQVLSNSLFYWILLKIWENKPKSKNKTWKESASYVTLINSTLKEKLKLDSNTISSKITTCGIICSIFIILRTRIIPIIMVLSRMLAKN